ncbi:Fe-S cluster assembly protein SufB [Candidatus Berkelbacteria bacterium]|nr:Fe-S cluster assembly protein SufB [Candidatus Berkelbacteria bacterium]
MSVKEQARIVGAEELSRLIGISQRVVKKISLAKGEPDWLLRFRLEALGFFSKMPLPDWGADLSRLTLSRIVSYLKTTPGSVRAWDQVPKSIRTTFERLGVPEAERKFLAGVGAQFESESVYQRLNEDLVNQGVTFCSLDEAVKLYPQVVKDYLGTIVSSSDNKFAALNSALWSGGSFVYVPDDVEVELPVQAYFRINSKNFGQFERTLIIAEPRARVHYIEGCTAPTYSEQSIHAAVVEVVAKESSKIRYTTIQNWSNNVYNLVTKRALAQKGSTVEWIDGNIGSMVTMKYPCVILAGKGARADILSLAVAGQGQEQDAGAKVIHLAPNTSANIVSKSISRDGGIATYRGLVKVEKEALGSKVSVNCDALLLDNYSKANTWPDIQVKNNRTSLAHEATVGQIDSDKIFYLMSRGISEIEAISLIVNGFIDDFSKELPMEYAVELNRLIQLEMEGSVG